MDQIKLIGRYIGKSKIIEVKPSENKSYLKKDLYKVELSDKRVLEYTEEALGNITTGKPIDLEELRTKATFPVGEKVLAILADSGLSIEDCKYLLQSKLPDSIEQSIGIVYRKFWDKEIYEITLLDVDKKLKNGKTNNKKN